MHKPIRSALISVYHKEGLGPLIEQLKFHNIQVYSTGGTQLFLESKGMQVYAVEQLTSYPSILDGRVKTLHPKVFGGILAKRQGDHLNELKEFDIPTFDLVVVDLYPFEQTLKQTDDENELIEKIDIGGIALLRAAAKNFKDVLVISSKDQYEEVANYLAEEIEITEDIRREFAAKAFHRTMSYDTHIGRWMGSLGTTLRYGENPHQHAQFFGNIDEVITKLQGKDLSYNNLVDIDSAIRLMQEFEFDEPTMAIIKHTNACGLATRKTVLEAWKAALAADPISAFGGIFICNQEIDKNTAEEINKLFYEVLIAPSFSEEALEVLSKNKKRILLVLEEYPTEQTVIKSCLNGLIHQTYDDDQSTPESIRVVTKKQPTEEDIEDMLFAEMSVKHLKSNGIALVKNKQLLGMGCGQTSRIDALRQAILKAKHFGFDLTNAVMASDAFFPFPDCVEIAHEAGIRAVIQPGGSIKDQLSIDFCDVHDMIMIMTSTRHFKH